MYPDLQKWLREIPPECVQGKYISCNELYCINISYDLDLIKGGCNNAYAEQVHSSYLMMKQICWHKKLLIILEIQETFSNK